jgi:iron complex outermembrane receptor protein
VSFGLSSPIIAATSRLFDLPAGPAEATVQMYARQAHISLLYEPGSLNGFKTRALKGKYEPIEALRLLLDGSGLDFVIPAPRYISVHPTEHPEASTRQIEILPTVVIDARTSATSLKLPPGVTVRTINAEELSLQGFTTVTDWVRSLTQNQGVGANEGTSYLREALSNVAYGSGLNLYGVGQRATLILVNGQRLAPSGQTGSFTDISNIPLTAVDHIDVMSDGASTIYGADRFARRVCETGDNIVTRTAGVSLGERFRTIVFDERRAVEISLGTRDLLPKRAARFGAGPGD